MLDELYKEGKAFEKHFEEPELSSDFFIDSKEESKYVRWVSKVATLTDTTVKNKYPEMMKEIIKIIDNGSWTKDSYNIIMGFLETSKELKDSVE